MFDLMYDGIDVNGWPADCQYGLVYTDGRYANLTAAKARFPAATFQTISAVGLVVADWIDCEPGCVWPPSAAVALYSQWRGRGCRGIYMAVTHKAEVKTACQVAGVTPELFGADWTNEPHINGDEAQTQFQNTPAYDVTAIPAPVAPPPVTPAPTPSGTTEDNPTGDDMPLTPEDITAVAGAVIAALRQEYAGKGNELYDRGIQYSMEAIYETGVAKRPAG